MLLANSKKQKLDTHSFAVGELASVLIENMNFKDDSVDILGEKTILCRLARISGYFHDCGKMDPNFQDYLKKNKISDSSKEDGAHILKETENFIRHNELSTLIYRKYINEQKLNISNMHNIISYVIYWHHSKMQRKDENVASLFLNQNKEFDIHQTLQLFIKNILDIEKNYHNKQISTISTFEDMHGLDEITPPVFKAEFIQSNDPTEIKYNLSAKKTLIRSCLVTADRIISSLDAKKLEDYIKNKNLNLLINEYQKNTLHDSISIMLHRYNTDFNRDRNNKQQVISQKLSTFDDMSVLSGPAGCGKTKIFLEWLYHLNNGKQVFIITPRNSICKGLYDELTTNYLPDANIEIYTSEYQIIKNKKDEQILNADIVITTIDQIVATMMSHKKIDIFLKILNANLIFDEYHEFFYLPGIILLFKELLVLKQTLNKSNTLLVSATVNYFFLKYLNINKSHIIKMETFNQSDFKFRFDCVNDSINLRDISINQAQKAGSIVIFNTALASQESSLYNIGKENTLNYHSKFNKIDKDLILSEILKGWSSDISNSDKVLRSGPIIQASLNISTANMLTEMTNAENWCQRLGRLNRFGTLNSSDLITIYKDDKETSRYLGQHNQIIAWKNFVTQQINTNKTYKLEYIYQLYEQFHLNPTTIDAYKKDFDLLIKKSIKMFQEHCFEPKQYTKSKGRSKLPQETLRGASIYILPLKLSISGTNMNKKWLCIPNDLSGDNLLTYERDDSFIKEAAISQRNMVFDTFPNEKSINMKMILPDLIHYSDYRKHKRFTTTSDQIINDARNPATPLIVSCLNKNYKNQHSLYYVEYSGVKIGLIESNKIDNIKDIA